MSKNSRETFNPKYDQMESIKQGFEYETFGNEKKSREAAQKISKSHEQ